MKRFIITLTICAFVGIPAFAQDPNFSQFFASPMTLNPALTGKFDGVYRFAANYRNQWPTINNAYTTMTASFDMGIMKNRIPEFDQFGVGLMAYSDKAGNGALNSTYYALSVAYHKALDENGYHQIGAGFQGTYMNKRLNTAKLTFQDQLTPMGFTGVTQESFSSSQVNLNYFDVNAGIIYNGSTNGYNNFYFGASMYHINRPTREKSRLAGSGSCATTVRSSYSCWLLPAVLGSVFMHAVNPSSTDWPGFRVMYSKACTG